jgi:NodT family efflux transporter outer membrane factor (OMF) lipoprotein
MKKQVITTILLLTTLMSNNPSLALPHERPSSPVTPAVDVPNTWEEGKPGQVLKTGIALVQEFPDSTWWQTFHDDHLSRYIELGLKNSPTLKASLARVNEAHEEMVETGAQELPSVNLGGDATRLNLPGNASALKIPKNLYAFPLQVSYEVDLFGKNWDKAQSAKKAMDADIEAQKAAQITLASNIATTYFNLLCSDALIHTQQTALDKFTRIHQLRLAQNSMGLSSYEEVIRADRDVAQAQTSLTLYQKQQALFAHQLSVLTGEPPVNESKLQRSTLESLQIPQQASTGIPATLLTRRPDILAEEKKLQQADIDIRVARKAFLPTINLSTIIGFGAASLGGIFNTSSFFSMIAGSVMQPIFEGGRLRAQVHYNQAKREEQLQQYKQKILTALQEVEDNLALLRANEENLDSNEKRLALTEHQLKLVEERYEEGLVPHVDVLQTQTELIQYQQLKIQSNTDTLVSMVGLYKALGGGF